MGPHDDILSFHNLLLFFFPFSIFDELIHNAVLILASSKKGSDIGLSVAKGFFFFFVSFAAIQ